MPTPSPFPRMLPMRQRAEVIHRLLNRWLAEVLPGAMRGAGIDCWVILCQEDSLYSLRHKAHDFDVPEARTIVERGLRWAAGVL